MTTNILENFLHENGWDGTTGDAGSSVLVSSKDDRLLYTIWTIRFVGNGSVSLHVLAQLCSGQINRIAEKLTRRKRVSAIFEQTSCSLVLVEPSVSDYKKVLKTLEFWCDGFNVEDLIEREAMRPLGDTYGDQLTALCCLVKIGATSDITTLLEGKVSGRNLKIVPAIKIDLIQKALLMAKKSFEY